MDYSKLSDAELEAIANNDYSKLSDETLRMISTGNEETTPQDTGMSATDIAGMGLGAVQAGYEHVLKPAANFALEHPIMTGIGASYLPESVRKYVPLAETLKNVREGLLNKATGTTYPPGSPVTGTPGVKIPINAGPLPTGTAVTGGAPAMAPQPPSATNYLSRMSQMASKYLPAAQVAANALLTSPDEIATLKAAEARKRAQGYQPANLMQGRFFGGYTQ